MKFRPGWLALQVFAGLSQQLNVTDLTFAPNVQWQQPGASRASHVCHVGLTTEHWRNPGSGFLCIDSEADA